MHTLTIEVDDAIYRVLAAAGPTPEAAAVRALAALPVNGDRRADLGAAAWAAFEAGLGSAGQPGSYADDHDRLLYGPDQERE